MRQPYWYLNVRSCFKFYSESVLFGYSEFVFGLFTSL